MTERYFVTGTDTEVGKTVASSALLQAARMQGKTTAGYKPVASGSEMTAHGLRNTDALALQRNSTLELAYSAVNPYTFAEPTRERRISYAVFCLKKKKKQKHTMNKRRPDNIREGNADPLKNKNRST